MCVEDGEVGLIFPFQKITKICRGISVGVPLVSNHIRGGGGG